MIVGKPTLNQTIFRGFNLLLILGCVALTDCQDLPTASEQNRINAFEGLLVGKKKWKSCQINWQLSTSNSAYNKPITAAFDVVSKAGTFLTFANQSPADISISFAPAAQLEKTISEGVLHFDLSTLAAIGQTTTGQYKIVLSQDYKWTDAQLQYVVMHQSGTILGLSPNQSSTQRYLPSSPTLALSDKEIVELKAMYPASGLPTIKTGQVTVAATTKTSVVEATVSNFATVPMVLSIGHCWSSKSQMPTLNDNEGMSGDGLTKSGQANTNATVSSLYGLVSGTKYYIRAYARNNCGVGYGGVVTYTKP